MSTGANLRRAVVTNPRVRQARCTLSDATAKLSSRLRPSGPAASPSSAVPLPAGEVSLQVSEWALFRSRLFARFALVGADGLPTRVLLVLPDGAIVLPDHAASGEAFDVDLSGHQIQDLGLRFEFADGRAWFVADPAEAGLRDDPGGKLFGRFAAELAARSPGRVLELGSRARSGNVYRGALVPESWEYTGLDIKDGPNVDLVGDAHDLVAAVGQARFDAVFSIATFEHLAMPWRAVVSVNEILEVGGLVYLGSHQAFPLHETPWDFWRFSDQAWRALFNTATGFEILEVAMGEPANVTPTFAKQALLGVSDQPAFLSSSVLARKVGPASVDWIVPTEQIVTEIYPH